MKSIQFQLLLLFLSCLLFFFPEICVEGAREGLVLWSGTIVPTLLPFLLLTGLMNKYQALHLVSMVFYPIYRKFPDLNRNLAYTLILGFFSEPKSSAIRFSPVPAQKKKASAFLLCAIM